MMTRSAGADERPAVLQIALMALEAGISVLPIRADGSKQPALSRWKGYQHVRPTTREVERWFRTGNVGLALVTGKISGGLVAIDFDDAATFDRWLASIQQDRSLSALYEQVACGYEEVSPTGGRHLLFRCAEPEQNRKFALRPLASPPGFQTLVETRAEGGLIIIDPSSGDVHKSKRPYRRLRGSVQTICRLTVGQRGRLYASLQALDERPQRAEPPQQLLSSPPAVESSSVSRTTPPCADNRRPGDLFNQAARWEDILCPHGWMFVRIQKDGEGIWRRPGKEPPAVSATTNYEGTDVLYVFSSSTAFEPEHAYTKFQAYAVLNHGGDFSAAARDLAKQGYTSRKGEQKHAPA